MKFKILKKFAKKIRQQALFMVTEAKSSHIGGSLSSADILAVLYGKILKIKPRSPKWDKRDRFIMSKGHCCSSVYAALALKGYISKKELKTFGKNASRLMTHVSHKVPGIEFSTGSLGHGLSFGVGKALAAKKMRKNWKTFVMLSDGDLDEGATWEALLFAAQAKLENLVVILDYNKQQGLGSVANIIELEPLRRKIESFRWCAREVNGHKIPEIYKMLSGVPWVQGTPSFLIAHTIKGKGVSFMENSLLWHYKSPNSEECLHAIREIQKRK